MKRGLRFKQLISCPWNGTYSVVGLTEEGIVYVYEKGKRGWVKYSMFEVDIHEVNND